MSYQPLLFVLLMISTTACSQSKPSRPEPKITTNITASGLKQFQVMMPAGGGEARKRSKQRPDLRDGSASRNDKKRRSRMDNKQNLKHIIQRVMEKDGFCTEGFMEVDRYSEGGTMYFRGQCNEIVDVSNN
ncbi:hypothetical protein OS175_05985 [Marinicella sp. S1101]|uniref:hypothetical protein n=1 Tax=Marinicella marina TaxID=2996016 RepID=UPI002260839D|nr:hypothetical protein [Marinicella marina]MCX7553421.1 hypothetical protein [Marinicella marina]MDJ1140045.1 hypothetical protein [Marinicella marina]